LTIESATESLRIGSSRYTTKGVDALTPLYAAPGKKFLSESLLISAFRILQWRKSKKIAKIRYLGIRSDSSGKKSHFLIYLFIKN